MYMVTLLEVIGIIFRTMTSRNFLVPRLAQLAGTVSQVMGLVCPVMPWLATVMASSEKVTGFLERFVSATCSGLAPTSATVSQAVPRGKRKLAHIYVNSKIFVHERDSGQRSQTVAVLISRTTRCGPPMPWRSG